MLNYCLNLHCIVLYFQKLPCINFCLIKTKLEHNLASFLPRNGPILSEIVPILPLFHQLFSCPYFYLSSIRLRKPLFLPSCFCCWFFVVSNQKKLGHPDAEFSKIGLRQMYMHFQVYLTIKPCQDFWLQLFKTIQYNLRFIQSWKFVGDWTSARAEFDKLLDIYYFKSSQFSRAWTWPPD